MTSIAEFTLPPADFPLGRLFETRPAVTLELDRIVPSGDTVLPYFWVHDPAGGMESNLEVFAGLPELRSVELLDDLGERGLFSSEWKPEYMGIMSAVPATGVTVLSATGSSEGWRFELRAQRTRQFSDFQQYCAEHDIPVTLRSLSRLSEGTAGARDGLTTDQREALVLAYREGYYDEPRTADQAAVAEKLGISRQALAARLRRGYRNLIERALIHPGDD